MTKVPMAALVNLLSTAAGRPVKDETDLAGEYDFSLNWASDEAVGREGVRSPSLFVALTEQLGLKLVPSKGAPAVLVIEHAEKPAPN